MLVHANVENTKLTSNQKQTKNPTYLQHSKGQVNYEVCFYFMLFTSGDKVIT